MHRDTANKLQIPARIGFTLLEVVIVVAITAIVAIVGIPRMSRGSRGARDSSLIGDLAVLRKAIDLYSAEHGGLLPTENKIEEQLTEYSDIDGLTNGSKGPSFVYGPYLRSIPPLPVGVRKGKSGIKDRNGGDVGWIYDEASGAIRANTMATEKDDAGRLYSDY
jgi:prepilin-type N-terminal cleavage/methylation domain-containing protein